MKKIRTKLLLLIFCILTVAIYSTYYYSRGHVRKAEFDYESPRLYTLAEVKEAGNLVVKDFETSEEYTGCELTRVYYDEELSK